MVLIFLFSWCSTISSILFCKSFILVFNSGCFSVAYLFFLFLVLLLRPNPLDSTHCWNLKCVEWNHESETFFNAFKECFCSITLSACIYSKTISCQDRIGESMFNKGVRSSKTFNTSNNSGFQMSVEKTKTDTESK